MADSNNISKAEDTNEAQRATEEGLTEPYIIPVIYNSSEVNNASWLVYREETGGKLVFGVYCSSFTITVFIGLACLGVFSKTPPSEEYATWLFLICVADVIFVPFLISILLWRALKKVQLNAYALQERYSLPTVYAINSAGVQIQIDSNTTITAWSSITACYELADSLAFVTGQTIFPIPKRCFYSNDQLKTVRQLFIKKAIPYSRIGPQNGNTTFVKEAELEAIGSTAAGLNDILSDDEQSLQVAELEATGSPEPHEFTSSGQPETTENRDLKLFADKHPNSLLITEPSILQPATQSITIECNYSMAELKQAEKQVFMKYDVGGMGIRYIGIFVLVLAYTKVIELIYGPVQGAEINSIILKCSPLVLLGAVAHARYIYEKRIDSLKEVLKEDLPIFVTLSSEECVVRSRRTLIAYKWPRISHCLSTKENYICLVGLGTVIIPKRAIDSSKTGYVENLLRRKIRNVEEWS